MLFKNTNQLANIYEKHYSMNNLKLEEMHQNESSPGTLFLNLAFQYYPHILEREQLSAGESKCRTPYRR